MILHTLNLDESISPHFPRYTAGALEFVFSILQIGLHTQVHRERFGTAKLQDSGRIANATQHVFPATKTWENGPIQMVILHSYVSLLESRGR